MNDTAHEVVPGMYRHFKGGLYEVLEVATHSETLEKLVVYRHADGTDNGLWVRPLGMFSEVIERDGKTPRRFTRVEEEGGKETGTASARP